MLVCVSNAQYVYLQAILTSWAPAYMHARHCAVACKGLIPWPSWHQIYPVNVSMTLLACLQRHAVYDRCLRPRSCALCCRLHILCSAVLEMLTLPTVSNSSAGSAGSVARPLRSRPASRGATSPAGAAGPGGGAAASSGEAAQAPAQEVRSESQSMQYWKEVALQLEGDPRYVPPAASSRQVLQHTSHCVTL